MTTDLPSIDLGKSVNYGLGFEQQSEAIFRSTGHVHNKNDPSAHLPEVTSSQTKRNSEGQVLQVKFAPNVGIPHLERVKTVVPGFDSAVHVDHKHYEQWARVPGRRMPSSTLLRGIQQLKSRMKRESMEQERYEAGFQKDFHINQLNRNSLLTRDKLSDDGSINLRREKSNIGSDSSGFRTQIQPRSPLKTSAHVIDSNVLKQEIQDSIEADDTEKEIESRSGRFLERESSRPRQGVVSKTRDKCALPVSVYQPISIGEHVFLVNEPIKYADFLKMKKTEYRVKKDPKSATMIFMPDRSGKIVNFPEPPGQNGNTSDKKDHLNESFYRGKTFTGGFPPSRKQKRTPVMVSSAELFDFSRLSELRHLMDDNVLERSKTEFSFPSKGGKYTKWVPNVQRLKDVVK